VEETITLRHMRDHATSINETGLTRIVKRKGLVTMEVFKVMSSKV
jgi:hypothetical protein